MTKAYKKILNSKTKNFIVTVAIGNKFYKDWLKYASPSWKKYCTKNNIGLIVFTKELIDRSNYFWKRANWQKMLIGDYLEKYEKNIKNICYLDTDILINPFSPNIFKHHIESKISVISETYNLPFNLNYVKRKVAFYRKKFYSKKYPLDSALFMTLKQKYQYHNVRPQKDYFCSGVIVFNVKKFSKIMKKWFFKYKHNIKTLTGGGEEPIFNYEIFNTRKVNLIDYKFQALWLYEMAHKYSFLYKYKSKKNEIIKKCIEESLLNNYFLHFPGNWYEGQMWKIKDIFNKKKLLITSEQFYKYSKIKLKAEPKGRILPK